MCGRWNESLEDSNPRYLKMKMRRVTILQICGPINLSMWNVFIRRTGTDGITDQQWTETLGLSNLSTYVVNTRTVLHQIYWCKLRRTCK